MTEPVSVAEHVAVTAAATAPDPAIAVGTDSDAPAKPGRVLPDRFVGYIGDAAVTVVDVGHWLVDEVKQVPHWLAVRLLQHQHFVEASAPADAPTDAPTDAEPVDKPARPAAKRTAN